HDAHMRRRHRRVLLAAKAAEVEVELVKLHTLDQLAECLGLECGQRRIAELLIGGPVAGGDAVEQSLIQRKEFGCCGVRHDRDLSKMLHGRSRSLEWTPRGTRLESF